MISYKIIFSEPNGFSGVAPKKNKKCKYQKYKVQTKAKYRSGETQGTKPETRTRNTPLGDTGRHGNRLRGTVKDSREHTHYIHKG